MEQSGGHGWLDAVHPDDRQPTLEAWHEAERSGSLYVEHRTRRAADGEYRWLQTRGVRLKGENSPEAEWFGTSTDVHDLRRAVERQQVLVRELHHRTRNPLGVVNAIARQTLTRSETVAEFSERFDSRIAALARVQTLVSRENSPELELRDLVQSEIRAHVSEVDGRILIEGPAVTLDEKVGETLALALHELVTNAVKYGALAGTNGQLSVNWTIDPASLTLEWRESGYQGPASKPGRGYGRELIEVALPFALGATTRYEVAQDGVYCLIALPHQEWSSRSKGRVSSSFSTEGMAVRRQRTANTALFTGIRRSPCASDRRAGGSCRSSRAPELGAFCIDGSAAVIPTTTLRPGYQHLRGQARPVCHGCLSGSTHRNASKRSASCSGLATTGSLSWQQAGSSSRRGSMMHTNGIPCSIKTAATASTGSPFRLTSSTAQSKSTARAFSIAWARLPKGPIMVQPSERRRAAI